MTLTLTHYMVRRAMWTAAALAFLAGYHHADAATASANQGHHSGGNHGAVGAAAGAFGGGSSAAGQSGQGGRYMFEDNYQPWPQAEMAQFQKPRWVPYTGG